MCTVTVLTLLGMVPSQSSCLLAEQEESSGIKRGLNCPGKRIKSGIKAWACSVQRLCTNSPLGKVRAVMCPSLEVPRGGMCCVCLADLGLGLEGRKGRSCSCSWRKAQFLLPVWALETHSSPRASPKVCSRPGLAQCWMSSLCHSSTSGVKLGQSPFHPTQ